MRVVMISKALVVGAYQRKLEELARLPGITLTAIVPAQWRDRRGHVALTHTHVTGYQLLVAPLVFNGAYHWHFYPTLAGLLDRLRPDILHVDEEPYNLATWHALLLGRRLATRSIFFTWQNLLRRYPWPFRAFEQASYAWAAHAIAGNQAAAQVLRAKGYAGPVTVIPQFGVDPEHFAPATRQFDPARPFVIGYAGGLVREKGVDLLLRACAGWKEGGWRLELVGAGPERPRLEALAQRLGIADRVHFLGYRPSSSLPEVYRGWDVLVLPSVSQPNWIEQFGRVLIEAMACGVPVIGSTCGEIPAVIGDAGLVFPEGDVAALRTALIALAADPRHRSELAAAGRARVLAHFTHARIAEETYQVYRQVMT